MSGVRVKVRARTVGTAAGSGRSARRFRGSKTLGPQEGL